MAIRIMGMNILAKIASFALFIGSFPLMGYAFQVPGWEAVIFGGAVVMSCVAWMIPLYLLPKYGK
ncbi:MAG: hypothetical protein RL431_1129 [Actinomycetota bacterium]|jgi:hypothetical protein